MVKIKSELEMNKVHYSHQCRYNTVLDQQKPQRKYHSVGNTYPTMFYWLEIEKVSFLQNQLFLYPHQMVWNKIQLVL